MKVHEYAKKHGMDTETVKEKFGLTSHLNKIPEEVLLMEDETASDIEVVDEEVVSSTPEPIVDVEEKMEDKCPIDIENLKLSLRGAGSKSPYWKFRHLVGRK